MFLYPVGVRSVHHRWFPKRHAPFVSRYRKQIEDYINEHETTGPKPDILSYGQIASGADVPKDVVEVFLRQMGGGHDGIIIRKRQAENNREAYRRPF